MKRLLKVASLTVFGIACGASGQYGYYADFMSNPIVLTLMMGVSAAIFVLLTEKPGGGRDE